MQVKLLFVYGTLRKGGENHYFIQSVPCWAERAWLQGTLADTGNGYPALVLSEGGRVAGELYLVDWDGIGKSLDRLEDYWGPGDARNEYERVEVQVETDRGPVQAWTYVYSEEQAASLRVISSGDWMVRGDG
ncbi:gamma-glutamylcyclotransferase family protein [Paenibacillus koleovorans]|uniref:gamma-glutamylcyclotransferase family protein n=1 Tax=Paenibacillus koleovorans TaxID=121608 RepID=UPI0013E3E08B|nr:gamma-glutamylcyclotransferase family protein [Paenibacillus koleovorans]